MNEELKISLSNLMPLSNNEKLKILKYIEKQDKEIERLKEELEYTIPIVEHNKMITKHLKEIERLNNIINNTTVELEILLQSEDFELITMQLRNIVFRLKGSVGNEICNQEDNK